jgi:hypothetical protein
MSLPLAQLLTDPSFPLVGGGVAPSTPSFSSSVPSSPQEAHPRSSGAPSLCPTFEGTKAAYISLLPPGRKPGTLVALGGPDMGQQLQDSVLWLIATTSLWEGASEMKWPLLV